MHIPVFTEKQKFDRIWTWVIMIVNVPIMILILVAAWLQEFRGRPFGNQPMSDTELWIFTAIMMILLIGTSSLFVICKLQTEILQTGIRYRLFPFQVRYRFVAWEDTEKVYVRKYRPLREFGGFGLRYSTKNGRAVNVRGDFGIQLELKSGKKLLVGTSSPEEAEKALNTIIPPLRNNSNTT